MPIVAFHNDRKTALALIVEPWGERHTIPYRSTAGIRYTLQEGAEDRSFCNVSRGQINFWCNSDGYEIDVVHPSACDNLLWDICVNGGWCGGIVNGEPTHVDDLLPKTGTVTAKDFARLAVKADGWPDAEPVPAKHFIWLEAKFIEHLGASEVPCETLRQITRSPFD